VKPSRFGEEQIAYSPRQAEELESAVLGLDEVDLLSAGAVEDLLQPPDLFVGELEAVRMRDERDRIIFGATQTIVVGVHGVRGLVALPLQPLAVPRSVNHEGVRTQLLGSP